MFLNNSSVILSEEFALRSKANPQSKDLCDLIATLS